MQQQPLGQTGSKEGLGEGQSRRFAVKNKTPNPVQITAEQLLREAVERQASEVRPPRQRVVDADELEEYRIRKRKDFEDAIRRARHNMGNWFRYAEWEATQRDFVRARSVYERALTVEFHNIGLWSKYIEMEMKNKFINSARNLLDRAVALLPRVDAFWLKYAHMEEILGNYAGARAVFERWMEWEPEEKAWLIYVKFEERCGELDRARKILERLLSCRPAQSSFLKFSKFEERHRDIVRARAGYEKAIDVLAPSALNENFYIKFAQFEERQKEFERVNKIFEQALERLPKDQSEELYRKYVAFQKQRGERDLLEKTVMNKRRVQYEEKLLKDLYDYDTWFDLLRLEEEAGTVDRIRTVYDKAVAQVPPIAEKRYWRRYIYLWITYALFEELQASDIGRARDVYTRMLQAVPHRQFSFAKLWICTAEFEIRQLQLDRARKLFGRAIAECGKEKIFKAYASLELRLGNIDRCRIIHAKFIERHPTNPKAWVAFIDLELLAEELERARALCEIGLGMEYIESPEVIWKRYIDIESNFNELGRVRILYERLLEKTKHFKVFKAYSSFEFEQAEAPDRGRSVIERGLLHCKDNKLREERKLLLEHWLSLERQIGDEKMISKIQEMRPRMVRVRKTIVGEDGTQQGVEESIQYVFPDDGAERPSLKILQKAKEWKKTLLTSS